MLPDTFQLPDAPILLTTIQGLATSCATTLKVAEILHRELSRYSSTSPTEVIKVRLEDGESIGLLCKYGSGSGENGFGHRGGVPYEAKIYRDLLTPMLNAHPSLRVPRYYGAHEHPETGETWIFLEFLEGCEGLDKTQDPSRSLPRTTTWIGTFHSYAETLLSSSGGHSITQYDRHYYAGWAERTLVFATYWQQELPWLKPVCDAFLDRIPYLLRAQQTVIHGEFYPMNVLLHKGEVHPVDWESTAIGPGEIDLAMLTDRWEDSLRTACEVEYCRVRWPEGEPPDFCERLTTARIYIRLRWLGDTSWGRNRELWRKAYAPEIDRLQADAIRFGLIG